MTRPYAHNPDEAFIRKRYPDEVAGIEQVRATIARLPQVADNGLMDSGLDAAREAAAFGWYLQEPTPQLREHLRLGTEFVHHGLKHPAAGELEFHSFNKWIAGAVMAGDLDLAATVGSRMPASPTIEKRGHSFAVMLAALARSDDTTAEHWARHLNGVLTDPGTAPVTVATLAALDRIGLAVLHHDQSALETGLHERDTALARHHRRSISTRRRAFPLLDPYGTAVALLGKSRGMPLPDQVPSVPAELFENL